MEPDMINLRDLALPKHCREKIRILAMPSEQIFRVSERSWSKKRCLIFKISKNLLLGEIKQSVPYENKSLSNQPLKISFHRMPFFILSRGIERKKFKDFETNSFKKNSVKLFPDFNLLNSIPCRLGLFFIQRAEVLQFFEE